MKYKRFIIILILFFCLGCAYGQVGLRPDQSVNISKTRVDLFVMSQCPYSVEAEKAIIPVIDRFRDRIDFKIYFIAYEADKVRERLENEILEEDITGDTGEGKCRGMPHLEPGARFYSLHGQPEVEEDMRQMVMMKHYPEKFLDYLLYRAENYASNDWEEAAVKAWMDIEHIQQLIKQPETEELFGLNIKKAHDMRIESSPTLVINGKMQKGPIDQFALSRYICKNSPRCKECKDIPVCGTDQDCRSENKVGLCLNQNTQQARCQFGAPIDIQLTIIREESKPDEGDDQIVSYSRSLFPKISIEELVYLDKQADELINKYRINVLSAYVYSQDIDKSLRFIRIEDMLLKKEDAYLINPKYLARAYYPDREDKQGQVDLFIESLSKAGNHIEKGLMNNPLFSDLNIKIHFWARKEETRAPENEGQAVLRMAASSDQSNILYLAPQQPQITFKSTQGLPEIEEDIKQLLIAASEGEKYPHYLSCMNDRILSDEDDEDPEFGIECLKQADINKAIISQWQMNSRGVELLLADIALAEELDLEFSPAVLINNKVLLRNVNLKILEEELLNY